MCINRDLCTVSFDVRYAESKGPSTNASPLLSLTPQRTARSLKPLRREGRNAPAALYARVRFCLRKLHARPRVQQAPGLPCALCVTRRVKNYTKLGRVPPRESGPMPHAVEILNQGLALHERSHATVQCSTSSMVAGLPFWSRGCGRLPVVTCSTECSKASPHFWIERHV